MKRIVLTILLAIFLFPTGSWAGPIITGCGQVPVMGHRGPQAASAWEPETCTYLALPNATIPGSVVDGYIKAIKAGSTVTLTSQTMNFPTANGTAFITNPLTDYRWMVGFKLTLTAGGKTLVGWGYGAASETLGSELITGWSNSIYPLETLTVNANGHDITRAVNTAGDYGAAVSNLLGSSAGWLLKWVYTRTVASGTVPALSMRLDTLLIQPTPAELNASTASNGSYYVTVNGDRRAANVLPDTSGTDFAATHSVKRVMAPSSNGLVIWDKTDQNWVSNDGIDPNAASFTLAITKN